MSNAENKNIIITSSQTAITPFILITLVVYIELGIAVKKRFVFPIFDLNSILYCNLYD